MYITCVAALEFITRCQNFTALAPSSHRSSKSFRAALPLGPGSTARSNHGFQRKDRSRVHALVGHCLANCMPLVTRLHRLLISPQFKVGGACSTSHFFTSFSNLVTFHRGKIKLEVQTSLLEDTLDTSKLFF